MPKFRCRSICRTTVVIESLAVAAASVSRWTSVCAASLLSSALDRTKDAEKLKPMAANRPTMALFSQKFYQWVDCVPHFTPWSRPIVMRRVTEVAIVPEALEVGKPFSLSAVPIQVSKE